MLRGRSVFTTASTFGCGCGVGVGWRNGSRPLPPGLTSSLQVAGQFRFQAHADRAYFKEATKDVPRTPDGSNPYEVLDMTPNEHTKLEEMAKQFKRLAVQNHPDREGGSHDKMAEVNAAFGIIKKHHANVVRRIGEHRNRGPQGDPAAGPRNARMRTGKTKKQQFEEDLGRSGGVRQNVKVMNAKSARTAAEISTAWELFKEDREAAAEKIGGRFEFACEQAVHYEKFSTVKEIMYRERWMRKQFLRGVWEDVHELRSELLKKGHRNTQMSQLAEEMVTFAKTLEDKLTEELQVQSEQSMMMGMRAYWIKVFKMLMSVLVGINCCILLSIIIFNNQWMIQFKEAIQGA